MKIKVAEATGPVLDWMVAKAEGRLDAWIRDDLRPGTSIKDIGFDDRHQLMVYVPGPRAVGGRRRDPYTEWKPSTDWSQGGPIIEREEIGIRRNAPCSKGCEWQGSPSITAKGAGGKWGYGPTPLIAAMRCFVSSKLGDEVDVPEELL